MNDFNDVPSSQKQLQAKINKIPRLWDVLSVGLRKRKRKEISGNYFCFVIVACCCGLYVPNIFITKATLSTHTLVIFEVDISPRFFSRWKFPPPPQKTWGKQCFEEFALGRAPQFFGYWVVRNHYQIPCNYNVVETCLFFSLSLFVFSISLSSHSISIHVSVVFIGSPSPSPSLSLSLSLYLSLSLSVSLSLSPFVLCQSYLSIFIPMYHWHVLTHFDSDFACWPLFAHVFHYCSSWMFLLNFGFLSPNFVFAIILLQR